MSVLTITPAVNTCAKILREDTSVHAIADTNWPAISIPAKVGADLNENTSPITVL